MGEFPKIEDFPLEDAEERAILPEVEQKIIQEMYELSIKRAGEKFEAHGEAKKIPIF